MPEAFRVTGAKQFEKAARAAAGFDKAQRREVSKVLRETTKPIRAELRESARANLPHAGGLNETVASSNFTQRLKVTGKTVGVTLVARGRSGKLKDIRSTDSGRLRHPVFADGAKSRRDWTWVTQTVKPGWWTGPLKKAGPRVSRNVAQAMDLVVNEIARRSK